MSKRNLRKKRFAEEESDGEEDGAPHVAPSAVRAAQQRKMKEKSAKKTSLLSFEDDVGRRRKEKHSRIRSAPVAQSLGTLTATPAYVSGAGEYTTEKLKELQLGTRKLPSIRKETSHGIDGNFVMSGDFVQKGTPTDDRFEHDLDVSIAKSNHDDKVESGLKLGTDRDKNTRSHSLEQKLSIDEETFEEEVDNASLRIPDSDVIRAAKLKREKMRTGFNIVPDYISLTEQNLEDDVINETIQRHRKMAEEDSILIQRKKNAAEDSENDHPEIGDIARVKFGVAHEKNGTFSLETEEISETEEEETAAWIESQLRKGMISGKGNLHTASNGTKTSQSKSQTCRQHSERKHSSVSKFKSQTAEINAAADTALEKLRSAFKRTNMSRNQTERNLEQTRKSLKENVKNAEQASKDLASAGERYVFLQQIRAYIAALCSMLAEKSPIVEELQEELQKIREERASAYFSKQKNNRREEAEPAKAAVEAALSCLMSDNPREASVAAESAAREAEAKLELGDHIPVELDEFGRDLNAVRRAKVAERIKTASARCAAELAKFDESSLHSSLPENSIQSTWIEPCVGDVTSDEEDEDIRIYRARTLEIYETAGSIFKDASDEFSSIDRIKDKLEQWKFRYPIQYRDAYVGLSAPALFAPFVRLELLHWDPLSFDELPQQFQGISNTCLVSSNAMSDRLKYMTTAKFDQQEWYKELFHYGIPESNNIDVVKPCLEDINPAEDIDNDLVPRLVSSLVVPFAEFLLERVWNPWSVKQSTAISEMVSDIMIYLPHEGSDEAGELIYLIMERLKEMTSEVSIPKWTPSAVMSSPRSQLFVARCFGRALRALRSICCFKDILPTSDVRNLAIGNILSHEILPYVRLGTAVSNATVAQRIKRVLDALPKALWSDSSNRNLCSELLVMKEILEALTRPLRDLPEEEAKAKGSREVFEALTRLHV